MELMEYLDETVAVEKRTPSTHTHRKKFGHHYYKRTHDIETLMKIFNYSSQKITKHYIGVTDDEINQLQNNFRLG
ncbi:integrase [Lactobacillus hilgardii]|uniref:Integrase n=2 Tax=Lentilactobacillus hilgardii TaxID=1588 RepID=C0XGL8_LENH9|nr:hypothetical protein HMPREF0519_0379 [Lentilactobacillus hilgardii DSM 20176 = ATCC 8290]KRK56799.1 integrase [Lentilactobacillus hilgardii DSM 20176 = ATCC 8290]QEU39424.1 tyrosine-type recombinase/integrase [Lentilactobacillus hilgardii]TDG85339.1 hypothetical protein C5L34_002597 [Lentilactobacillus hilgardii]